MYTNYPRQALTRLRPSIVDGKVRRSQLENVLTKLGQPKMMVRPGLEQLLKQSYVTIIEDISLDYEPEPARKSPTGNRRKVSRHKKPAAKKALRPLQKSSDNQGRMTSQTEITDERSNPKGIQRNTTRANISAPETLDSEDHDEQRSTRKKAANSIPHYFTRVRDIQLLTSAEEKELATRIEVGLYASQLIDKKVRTTPTTKRDLIYLKQSGDEARIRFIEANLRLVNWVAKDYTGRGLEYQDLVQEGNLGLIHAVSKYDYTKGTRFSTYAIHWIKQAILRGIADKGRAIRLPSHINEKLSKLAREHEFQALEGKSPNAESLASGTGFSVEEVRTLLAVSKFEIVSLDEPPEGGRTPRIRELERKLENLDDSNILLEHSRNRQIGIALAKLSPREQTLFRYRFGLDGGKPLTMTEAAKLLSLTSSRLYQVESKAMSKLRRYPTYNALKRYY